VPVFPILGVRGLQPPNVFRFGSLPHAMNITLIQVSAMVSSLAVLLYWLGVKPSQSTRPRNKLVQIRNRLTAASIPKDQRRGGTAWPAPVAFHFIFIPVFEGPQSLLFFFPYDRLAVSIIDKLTPS